jgi:hypothetical protein
LKKNLDLLYESKQKLCLLREKTEKTSGTLYSVFKEPDPGFHRGRAVPPAQLTDNLRPETEISDYAIFSARSTKNLRELDEGTGSRRPGFGKIWDPFGWTRNIGVPGRPVKGSRKII